MRPLQSPVPGREHFLPLAPERLFLTAFWKILLEHLTLFLPSPSRQETPRRRRLPQRKIPSYDNRDETTSGFLSHPPLSDHQVDSPIHSRHVVEARNILCEIRNLWVLHRRHVDFFSEHAPTASVYLHEGRRRMLSSPGVSSQNVLSRSYGRLRRRRLPQPSYDNHNRDESFLLTSIDLAQSCP